MIASVTPVVLCLHLQVPRLISQTWPAIEGRKYVAIGFKGVKKFFLCPSKPPGNKFPETFLSSFYSVFTQSSAERLCSDLLHLEKKKIKSVRHFKHWKIIRNGVARRWRGGFSPPSSLVQSVRGGRLMMFKQQLKRPARAFIKSSEGDS